MSETTIEQYTLPNTTNEIKASTLPNTTNDIKTSTTFQTTIVNNNAEYGTIDDNK